MKKTKILFIVFSAVLMSFLFYSCSQEDDDDTMSKSDRLHAFIDDLNDNRTNVYTHCHPSAGMYASSRTPAFWETVFPEANNPYALYSYDGGATILDCDGGALDGQPIAFTMLEDGADNWKISKIVISNTTKFQ